MNENKLNTFFSTLSVVLVLFGYQFVTTLFGNSMTVDNSRSVTLPFRMLTIAILVITWYLNRNTKINLNNLKILWVYWALLLLRMFYDMFLRTDIPPISSDQRNVIILLSISQALLPSIVFSKSYKYIDFDKLLTWGFFLTHATILIAMFINTSAFITGDVETGERLTANVALNSISTGTLGLMAIIVAIELLRQRKLSFIVKLFVLLMIFIDMVFMLRAGSRGPLLSGAVVGVFAILSLTKNRAVNVLLLLVGGIILWFSIDYLELVVSNVSPVLHNRIFGKTMEDQLYGRENLYSLAFNYFLDSPIWGKYFALYRGGSVVWVHNIFLDSLLQLGIIGFALILTIIIKSCKRVIAIGKSKANYFWLALVLIAGIVGGMVSSVFYTSETISPIYALLFMPIESQNISIFKHK